VGIVDDDADDDAGGGGGGVGRERAGAGIERENPCLFGFFLLPLVDGRWRGGGRVRDDEPNLDWIAFANESVDSGGWPGFGLEAGTFVEKKSWSAMSVFPVVTERGGRELAEHGWREREEKGKRL
jgi:hypothetical protein